MSWLPAPSVPPPRGYGPMAGWPYKLQNQAKLTKTKQASQSKHSKRSLCKSLDSLTCRGASQGRLYPTDHTDHTNHTNHTNLQLTRIP